MSDGPHRSLPMRRGWKLVTERSGKRAYASEEISDAILVALEQDCRTEMPAPFIDAAWRIFLRSRACLVHSFSSSQAGNAETGCRPRDRAAGA